MRNIVEQFLNELRRREMGALLFSPNTRELYELCDRIYRIQKGRVEDEIVVGERRGS